MYNLKEHALKHVMTFLIDFYGNNSFREILEVIGLKE